MNGLILGFDLGGLLLQLVLRIATLLKPYGWSDAELKTSTRLLINSQFVLYLKGCGSTEVLECIIEIVTRNRFLFVVHELRRCKIGTCFVSHPLAHS